MQFQYVIDPDTNEVSTKYIKMTEGDPDCPLMVPNSSDNRHWKLYQEWLAESEENIPLDPEE